MAAAAITTSMLPVLPLLSLACAPTPAPPPEPAVEEAPAARLAHDRHVEWRGTASGLGADVPAVVRVTPWDVKPAHFFSASHPDAERFRPAAGIMCCSAATKAAATGFSAIDRKAVRSSVW